MTHTAWPKSGSMPISPGEYSYGRDAREKSFPRLVDVRLMLLEIGREEHQQDELGYLRRLKREQGTVAQPAVSSIDAGLRQNQHETGDAQNEEQLDHLLLLPEVIIQIEQENHEEKSQSRIGELAKEIVVRDADIWSRPRPKRRCRP